MIPARNIGTLASAERLAGNVTFGEGTARLREAVRSLIGAGRRKILIKSST